MKEGLIFCHVVGAGLEVEVEHVAELVSFGGGQDDPSPCTVGVLGAVEMERPVVEVWELLWLLCLFPFGEEIGQGLRFDLFAWLVLDVVSLT